MDGTTKIRVRGLVRAMRDVRARLAEGISSQEREAFAERVTGLVDRVDVLCHRYGIQPEQLPTPSYRAYLFLKSLDLEELPAPQGEVEVGTARVSGLISTQRRMNAAFAALIARPDVDAATLPEDHPEVQALLDEIHLTLSRVEELCEEQGATPGHLPVRSRRVYQWLSFLGSEGHLLTHLAALDVVTGLAADVVCRERLPPSRRGLTARFDFAYASALYRARARPKTKSLQVTLHEGFVGAPARVLRALVATAVGVGTDERRDRIREYAAGEAFGEVVTTLEWATVDAHHQPRGRYFDLEEVFNRVNDAYFEGGMKRPYLAWSTIPTHRKMGHYAPLTDTVMVSLSLDAPGVPEYVLDYVMYHELLHKLHGVRVVEGRRYAHTPAFRKDEGLFERYEEAESFLKRMK